MTIETITIPLSEWKEIADADNRACEYAHRIGAMEAEIERLRAAADGVEGGDELTDLFFAALQLRYGETDRSAAEYLAGLVSLAGGERAQPKEKYDDPPITSWTL